MPSVLHFLTRVNQRYADPVGTRDVEGKTPNRRQPVIEDLRLRRRLLPLVYNNVTAALARSGAVRWQVHEALFFDHNAFKKLGTGLIPFLHSDGHAYRISHFESGDALL